MKTKLITTILLSFSLLFLISAPVFTKSIDDSEINHSSSPTIQWVPEKFSEKIFIGGSAVSEISFVSKKDLSEVSVFIVPELKPFISVESEYFASIKAGEENKLELEISIPDDMSLGVVEGTIHLKALKQKGKKDKASRTFARSLPVTLEIIKPTEPTEAVNSLSDFLIEEFGTLTPSTSAVPPSTELPTELEEVFDEVGAEVVVIKSGSLVFSGFMFPNAEAKSAMFDLLNLLEAKGVLIEDLNSALGNHDLHREGVEAGWAFIPVDSRASLFYPWPKAFNLSDYDANGWYDTFVIVSDNDTHAVHSVEDLEKLINRDFIIEDKYLTEAASTAIHELIHAMIFRTSCFSGSIGEEEDFVGQYFEPLIKLKIEGNLPGFILILKEAIQLFPQGKNCLDRLGLVLPGPSLADTPWPMFQHDIQHTGRSPYPGAQTSNIKWTFQATQNISSSPVIGIDRIIYIVSLDQKLYAVNPDGTLRWTYDVGYTISTPAIAADGTIYLKAIDKLYAVSSDGTLKWGYNAWGHSSPTLAQDGTIYIQSCCWEPGKLYAINPDGTVKWIYSVGPMSTTLSSPAIGPDGIIYVAFGKKIYAINPDGTLKWSYYLGDYSEVQGSSPLLGPDGTVYIGTVPIDNKLYAINSNGTLKWTYTTQGSIMSSPAIGLDGTVYFGSSDGKLYALNPDGSLKWSYPTGGGYGKGIYSSPAIGSDGIVYFGTSDYRPYDYFFGRIYAVNSNGNLKWSFEVGRGIVPYHGGVTSPAIGNDGVVYIGACDGKLYTFGE